MKDYDELAFTDAAIRKFWRKGKKGETCERSARGVRRRSENMSRKDAVRAFEEGGAVISEKVMRKFKGELNRGKGKKKKEKRKGNGKSGGKTVERVENAKPIGEMNLGHSLLKKMGWKEGQGLGTGSQGRKDPIALSAQRGRQGLGS